MFGRLFRRKPKNPLMAVSVYADLVRKEREARARHQQVNPIRREKTALLHDALERGRA